MFTNLERLHTVEPAGAFTFVLHSHLPYARMAGRWPHGEEWIHEAATETYIPLLNALNDLREEGVEFHLTVGLTPILVEQLADKDVLEHLDAYLDERLRPPAPISSASAALTRLTSMEYLARWYTNWFETVKRSFDNRYKRDIVGAFRKLQDEGFIEIITSAATHGYLPLLGRDSSIHGQLRVGVTAYKRHFGRAPRAVWLPECAYRPAYLDEDGRKRPGI
jgi:1,4-alpha-glucan branching enzyme